MVHVDSTRPTNHTRSEKVWEALAYDLGPKKIAFILYIANWINSKTFVVELLIEAERLVSFCL